MTKIVNLSSLAANAEAEAFGKLLDGGFIDIFDGEMPPDADVPVNGQRRGVTLRLGAPAFGAAASGIVVASNIEPGVADAAIKATWARLFRADHATAVMDVTVGERDAAIVLPSIDIPRGITVSCSFFSHSVPRKG